MFMGLVESCFVLIIHDYDYKFVNADWRWTAAIASKSWWANSARGCASFSCFSYVFIRGVTGRVIFPTGVFVLNASTFFICLIIIFCLLLFLVIYIFIFCFFSDDTQFEYDDGIFGSAFTRRGICVARGSIFFNFLQWYFCYFQVASTEPSLSLKDSSTSKAADFLSSILNHASPPGNNVHHAADSPALFAE